MSILGSKGNRLIGLEHLIKKIQFRPKPLNVQITVKKDFSVANASSAVMDLLADQYAYENQNPDHTIGSLLSQTDIRNSINNISSTYGITDITFNNTDSTTASEDIYYFFLDQSVFDKLKAIETANPIYLTGISDYFKILVTAVSESSVQ
jgi:hypothetical protein